MFNNLPPLWREAMLGDTLSSIKNGTTQRQNQEGLGIPVTRIETISEGYIDPTRVGWVELYDQDLSEYELQAGDILFSHINSFERLGNCAIYEGSPPYLLHGMNLLRLRCNKALIDPYFLLNYFHSQSALHAIRTRAGQAVNQASINQTNLQTIPVPLPPLLEQRRIVAILRKADELRQLRRKANAKAQQLLPALFYEMFGDRQSFPVKKLSTFADTRYGTSKKADDSPTRGISVLRIPNIVGIRTDRSDLKYVSLTAQEWSSLNLKYGDVLIVRSNGNAEYVGRSIPYDEINQRETFASYLIRIRVDLNQILPEYLSDYFKTTEGRNQIREKTRTSAGQYNINSEAINDFLIPIPDLAIQQRYVKLRSHILNWEALKGTYANSLEKLGQSLLASAFTGELTAAWREAHAAELAEAAAERDRLLKPGTKRLLNREDVLRLVEAARLEDLQEVVVNTVAPALQQALTSLEPMRALINNLMEGPLARLSKQITEAAAINQKIIDSTIAHTAQRLVIEQQDFLARMVEPVQMAQSAFSASISAQSIKMFQNLVNSPNMSWLTKLAHEAAEALQLPESSHPRYSLLRSLNREQYRLFLTVKSFNNYVTAESLADTTDLSADAIRRGLRLLAESGLIQQLSVPTNPTGDRTVYVTVYRALRDYDEARIDDLGVLTPTAKP